MPNAILPANATETAEASVTAGPTELGGAPEAIFVEVGSTATLSGQHGVSGKAVVAGLQTLIILMFRFDGKVRADIRLVKDDAFSEPVHIVTTLERAYDGEMLKFPIPAELGPGTANAIAVYDTDSGQVLASAIFR